MQNAHGGRGEKEGGEKKEKGGGEKDLEARARRFIDGATHHFSVMGRKKSGGGGSYAILIV